MRTGFLAMGAALAIGAALASPGVAVAEPYPAGAVQMTVSAGSVAAGGAIQVSGTGYGANEDVTIDVVYAEALGRLGRSAPRAGALDIVATVGTDSNGDWSTSITLTQVGVATITSTGLESGVSETATVTVGDGLPLTDDETGDGGGDGDDALPITGSRLSTAILIGSLAVITGALLLWLPFAARRRGRHAENG
jgi:hypothetical protein